MSTLAGAYRQGDLSVAYPPASNVSYVVACAMSPVTLFLHLITVTLLSPRCHLRLLR
ncbi:hypothetical protein HNR62_003099 [Oceanisphaera litoralis]|uniref:hypothetical protein n=1 Tax=Oceanisphaera litoralis TaxID=225144 RepID=UPI00195C6CFB|nr:hypothetical protein [Oceanisphaera litoralis]MBM7457187.1 hypothetical protein [Oceanisphaera litoralis]